MNKSNLSKRLLRYFLLSTMLPFLVIVIIGSIIFLNYYKYNIDTVVDSYAKSLSREVSIYMNQLKQILSIPSFSIETIEKIKEIRIKDRMNYSDMDDFNNIMGNLISSIRYVGNDFHSAMIVTEENTIYYSSNYSQATPYLNYDWKSESWFNSAIENNGKILFIPPHIPTYFDKEVEDQRISIVSTIRNWITTEPYAVIKIDILPAMIGEYLELEELHVNSAIYIEDENGTIIFYEATTDRMKDSLNKISEGINGSDFFDIADDIDGTPYKLHVLLDNHAIIMNYIRFYIICFILYITAIVTAMYMNRRFSRRIYQPVESMKELLLHVETGDFEFRYIHREQWELEDLGKSLNEMVIRLESTIEKTYKAQLAQKEAENKALLRQIQPHFIFNTLNTMIGLIYQEKYEKLEENIFCLSDMLRTVLQKDLYCTLEEEVRFVENYLILQSSRFENRLSYNIEFDDSIATVQFPRLLLQPFVENSIVHGMEPLNGKVFVSIKIFRNMNNLKIIVSDNGIGFDTNKIDIMKSIGISNCVERLSLLYENSNIAVESSIGNGCVVTIECTFEENI